MEERVHEELHEVVHKGFQEIAHEGVQEQLKKKQGIDIVWEEIAAVDKSLEIPEDCIRFLKGK